MLQTLTVHFNAWKNKFRHTHYSLKLNVQLYFINNCTEIWNWQEKLKVPSLSFLGKAVSTTDLSLEVKNTIEQKKRVKVNSGFDKFYLKI